MPAPEIALVVDDEAHIRAYVRLMLLRLGVKTVFEAGTVAAGLDLWTEKRPGLVMLDVNLPGGSGLGLLQQIRAQDEEVYVVMLSANAQAATVKEAVDSGADGFLRKDMPRDELLAELAAVWADED